MMRPRDYQRTAIDGIFSAWRTAPATLAVMPTGTGKTIVFAHVIDRRPPGRAMVLAHRDILIWQSADKIERVTGTRPAIEMAEHEAGDTLLEKADVVVSTIQTQCAGKNGGRMNRFDPKDFSLLIIDEAHHVPAETYRRVIDYYRQNPNLRVLGVTATPDRADEKALGRVFETVAFDYQLPDAIKDGWLVPIVQRSVHVEGLDLSAVRTTAGDLNGADLARVIEYEEDHHGIVGPTVDLVGDRRTLVFSPSCAHAQTVCDIFNRHRPGCAQFVHAKTPPEQRRVMFTDYAAGRFQFLVNVGIATEGFDDYGVQVVVIGRPTKSRALFAQMVGRGTRVHPDAGIDQAPDATAADRRAMIAFSAKPNVEVIDFVGNAGRHKLVTTADILGGNYSDAVVERAARTAQKAGKPVDMLEALATAEKEIHEEKANQLRLRLKANYRTSVVDPFDLFAIEPWQERGWNVGRQPSEKQLAYLESRGIDRDTIKTFTQASQMISTLIGRQNEGRCTYKQARLLAKHGYSPDCTFDEARQIIDQIAKKQGWADKPRQSSSPAAAPPPPPTGSVKVY